MCVLKHFSLCVTCDLFLSPLRLLLLYIHFTFTGCVASFLGLSAYILRPKGKKRRRSRKEKKKEKKAKKEKARRRAIEKVERARRERRERREKREKEEKRQRRLRRRRRMEATAAMEGEAVPAGPLTGTVDRPLDTRGQRGFQDLRQHQKNILERQTQGGEDAGGDDNMPEMNAAQLMRDGTGSDDGVGVGVNRLGLSEIGSVFDGDDGSDEWLAAAAVAEVAQEKVTKYIIFSVATYIH